MPCVFERLEQVGVIGCRYIDHLAISKYSSRIKYIVGHQPVGTLAKSVTAAQGYAHESYAFTGTGNGFFGGYVKCLDDFQICDSALHCCIISLGKNGDLVHGSKAYLQIISQPSKRLKGPVTPSRGGEWGGVAIGMEDCRDIIIYVVTVW